MEYKTIPKSNTIFMCPVGCILKSIVLSYIISIIFFLIFSFVITYTNVPYSIITPVSVMITLLSIFIPSVVNGKKSSEKGWLTGCITGFTYMFILYIAGCIIFNSPAISSNGIIMIILGVFTGITGSIIGINNKKNYRK